MKAQQAGMPLFCWLLTTVGGSLLAWIKLKETRGNYFLYTSQKANYFKMFKSVCK